MDKTWIRAPFRGLVIRKDAEVGEVIAPTGAGNSRGSVFTIVAPESLEVQVELSERRIRRVKEGDLASVHLDADPESALPARVRKVWPRADRTKGTIELRVALLEQPADLRPEMGARVVFRGEEAPAPKADPYVTVPLAAVAKRDGDPAVFVLTAGMARLVKVTLGDRQGETVVVLEGLEGGEEVLLDPPADLEDGADVEAGRET